MLEELRNINFPGTKDGLIYIIYNLSKQINISVNDMRIMCAHAPGQYDISFDALLTYCKCFGFAVIDKEISLTEELQHYMKTPEQLNRYMVEKSIELLFDFEIFQPQMFTFEIITNKYLFHNEFLSLDYAAIRNILVSQGFFVVNRIPTKTVFYIDSDYEKIISSFCQKHKRRITFKQLQKRLDDNVIAGAKAEKFVLDFERSRLGGNFGSKVKLISDIDVSAGYDIISFNTPSSSEYDRFIEVKAISSGDSFYWSSNEYETAKLKGEQYFLYLVSLCKMEEEGYIPIIVQDPAHAIMETTEWLVEPETYHIRRISF